MRVEVQHSSIQNVEADAIVVNLFRGVTTPGGATGAVDAALGGRISRLIASGDFKGKADDVITLDAADGVAAKRVLVVGLGARSEFSLEAVRRAAAAAAKEARRRGAEHLATITHGSGIGGLDPREAAEATALGSILGLYTFDVYKGSGSADVQDRQPERLTVAEHDEALLDEVEAGARSGEHLAAAVRLARDLGNHPANIATPTYLLAQATELADRHGMRVESWNREKIVAEGMGALASVAAGTEEPPCFIVVEHAPEGVRDEPPLVMAGKAITFDSGGISLKPGLKMGRMKYDMCGGAAVLGAMEAVGRLSLPVHVYGLVAATENLPSGTATKPGDVVTALNGTTIEILNTDAEGRLVLADALSYAQRLGPRAVVDVATLTGAVLVALGRYAAGLFSNDDQLAAELVASGERTGERLWRLPTWDVYDSMVESKVADLKNTSDTRPAPAGAIFGAKFLERFVDYPWAHLDIAAVAWDAGNIPYAPPGASGFGTRLLVDWLRAHCPEAS